MPRNQLLDELFRHFQERERWSIKVLRDRTQQPEAYLKEVLGEIADLNRSGEFNGTWELKPNFRGEGVRRGLILSPRVRRLAGADDEVHRSRSRQSRFPERAACLQTLGWLETGLSTRMTTTRMMMMTMTMMRIWRRYLELLVSPTYEFCLVPLIIFRCPSCSHQTQTPVTLTI